MRDKTGLDSQTGRTWWSRSVKQRAERAEPLPPEQTTRCLPLSGLVRTLRASWRDPRRHLARLVLTSRGGIRRHAPPNPEGPARVALTTRPAPRSSRSGRRPGPRQGAPSLAPNQQGDSGERTRLIQHLPVSRVCVYWGARAPRKVTAVWRWPQVAAQTAAANHDDAALTFTFPIIPLLCLRGIFSSLNSHPPGLLIDTFFSPVHI